jgi:hypothetical protein
MDTLRTAQLYCLSMDLVSPYAIKDIFNGIVDRATQSQMRLLINHPSDLFQLEASYNIELKSVKLFIHVPMAPTDSLLWLLNFHPFLLPFTNTYWFLPDCDKSLLSLYWGSLTQLHDESSQASFAG